MQLTPIEKLIGKSKSGTQSKYDLPYVSICYIHVSRWKEWLDFLHASGVKTMVEIGTYKGKFAERICERIPGVRLTVIDMWKAYDSYKDFEENDLETNAYQQAMDRSVQCGFKIIRDWSLEAVKRFKDESLDAIFIDGNHDFRHVVDDVAEWSKKVRSGGIVAGHDFFQNRHKGFGVRDAIPAWCRHMQIGRLYVTSGDKCPSWFYIKP